MSRYQVSIKIPLDAMDTPDARAKANMLIDELKHIIPSNSVTKLQMLKDNSNPIGIELNLRS